MLIYQKQNQKIAEKKQTGSINDILGVSNSTRWKVYRIPSQPQRSNKSMLFGVCSTPLHFTQAHCIVDTAGIWLTATFHVENRCVCVANPIRDWKFRAATLIGMRLTYLYWLATALSLLSSEDVFLPVTSPRTFLPVFLSAILCVNWKSISCRSLPQPLSRFNHFARLRMSMHALWFISGAFALLSIVVWISFVT